MVMRRSNALLEVSDIFWFNGLRGQGEDTSTTQLLVAGISIDGKVEILVSRGPDDSFKPADLHVPILTAMHLVETHVWQMVAPDEERT